MQIELRIFVMIKVISGPWVGGCVDEKGPCAAGNEEEAKAVFPATLKFLTTDTDVFKQAKQSVVMLCVMVCNRKWEASMKGHNLGGLPCLSIINIIMC